MISLPAVPEENFIQKREVTVDSYSESISSNEESSDDRTVTMQTVIVLLHIKILKKHHASGEPILKGLSLPFIK